MSRWIALFSQTGSELSEVSKAIGRVPDITMTTNTRIPIMAITGKATYKGSHAALMNVLRSQIVEGDIVTLHGYLHIIGKNVLNCGAEFYNGHPGLISKYPELKGLDPQKRTWENIDKYDSVGCVIHRVTPEVDSGEIVAKMSTALTDETKPSSQAELEDILHTMSIQLWIDILPQLLGGI